MNWETQYNPSNFYLWILEHESPYPNTEKTGIRIQKDENAGREAFDPILPWQ